MGSKHPASHWVPRLRDVPVDDAADSAEPRLDALSRPKNRGRDPFRVICYSIRFHAPYFSEGKAFDLAVAGRTIPDLASILALKLDDRLEDLRDALCHLGRKVPALSGPLLIREHDSPIFLTKRSLSAWPWSIAQSPW